MTKYTLYWHRSVQSHHIALISINYEFKSKPIHWSPLSLALFAVLESVCQGIERHVSVGLLAVVSHQSNPYHLMWRKAK